MSEKPWAPENERIAAWAAIPDILRQEIGDRMHALIAERNRWAKRAEEAERRLEERDA